MKQRALVQTQGLPKKQRQFPKAPQRYLKIGKDTYVEFTAK